MERIHLFDKDIPSIGLHCRASTQGEEFDLVKEFIEYYSSRFLRDNKVNNLAIFIEPHIVSGFPDIVFVSYSPTILDNWNQSRKALTIQIILCGGYFAILFRGQSKSLSGGTKEKTAMP